MKESYESSSSFDTDRSRSKTKGLKHINITDLTDNKVEIKKDLRKVEAINEEEEDILHSPGPNHFELSYSSKSKEDEEVQESDNFSSDINDSVPAKT